MEIETISEIFGKIFSILAVSWWLILPLFLLFVFLDFWLKSVRRAYVLKIPWKLLEIKIPREILKTPKAMEQVFAAVHSIKTKIRFFEKWWKGKVQNWMSFELVGHAGGVHFYVRTPEEFRNLTESAIYAQYPDAEIVAVEDYVDLAPAVLPNKIYDLWGANFILDKENAYPLRTYEYFEERVKEKRLDPMAAVTEALSKAKEDEMAWLQILVRPVGDEWKKEGEKLIGKLVGRKSAKERTILEDLEEFIINLIKAPFTPPTWSEGGEEGSKGEVGSLTPGERDVVAAIENKISKLGFEAVVRFVYIDKAASFTRSNVAAVTGALQQFNTQHLNALKFHPKTTTKTFQPFKEHKLYYRKRKIFDDYRLRKFSSLLKLPKPPIFNTEELATIYHPPTIFVEAPTLRRLESRRGEPPAELPTLE